MACLIVRIGYKIAEATYNYTLIALNSDRLLKLTIPFWARTHLTLRYIISKLQYVSCISYTVYERKSLLFSRTTLVVMGMIFSWSVLLNLPNIYIFAIISTSLGLNGALCLSYQITHN